MRTWCWVVAANLATKTFRAGYQGVVEAYLSSRQPTKLAVAMGPTLADLSPVAAAKVFPKHEVKVLQSEFRFPQQEAGASPAARTAAADQAALL